jgi:hypothetical protein
MPRPPETMILAEVSSGHEAGQAAVCGDLDFLNFRISTRRSNRVEGSRPDRDDLDRIPGLHGRQRVAGIDGPHESVGALDGDDVGDLLHV